MQHVGFVVLPGFQMMSLAVLTVFELANKEFGKAVYAVRLLSETGGLIQSSSGIGVMTEPFQNAKLDTLLVGGSAVKGAVTPGVKAFLRKAVKRHRRVASTCVGAFVLAEAGLLDGRRATTHWNRAHELQSRFAKVRVEEDRIFIIDGPVWTSAGMTAGVDLTLAMVEQDFGAELNSIHFPQARHVSSPCRWPVAVFSAVADGAEIGSDSGSAGICKAQSGQAADGEPTRRSGVPQSASVQPCFSRGDR